MNPNALKDAEIRSLCKEKIESLEHWLRRLIDDTLAPIYGDYFAHTDASGNRLVKTPSRNRLQRVEQPSLFAIHVVSTLYFWKMQSTYCANPIFLRITFNRRSAPPSRMEERKPEPF